MPKNTIHIWLFVCIFIFCIYNETNAKIKNGKNNRSQNRTQKLWFLGVDLIYYLYTEASKLWYSNRGWKKSSVILLVFITITNHSPTITKKNIYTQQCLIMVWIIRGVVFGFEIIYFINAIFTGKIFPRSALIKAVVFL